MGKKCLVSIDGGMGKNVMFTSLLPKLKEVYEDIYVMSPYFDIFKCCSLVTDSFSTGTVSVYSLVKDPECDVFCYEPYSNQRFIKKSCHLFSAWAEGLNLVNKESDIATDKGSLLVPNIDNGSEFSGLLKEANEWKLQHKKVIAVQFCGGQSPLGDIAKTKYDDHQEVIRRNFYKGQELIDALHEEYPDAEIIHYSLPNEPSYNNTTKLEHPYLFYNFIADSLFKVVCTDSSLQHLVTGKCKDVTVIWGETRPEHFGYACNKNICADLPYDTQPYFRPMGSMPAIVKFPSVKEVMDLVRS